MVLFLGSASVIHNSALRGGTAYHLGREEHTWRIDSVPANATISAQDTVFGHAVSIRALMSSMTSKPANVMLWKASFSLELWTVELRRTDPSQPCRE